MSSSPEEDPPPFDSPPGAHVRSSDGVVTAPSTISRRAGKSVDRRDDTEDLRSSNVTEEEEMRQNRCPPNEPVQTPSIDLDLSFLDQSAKATRPTAPHTMSNSILQNFDPLIEDGRSPENVGTPAPSVPEVSQENNASTKSARHSLSALFQAWNHLLLGQSAASPSTPAVNLAGQLPSTQHPIFSPLLGHLKSGSKLSGAVASLLSPWAGTAAAEGGDQKDPDTSVGAAADPADDSLADLFNRINLKDADSGNNPTGEEEEEKEAFFSPDRGRASPTGPTAPFGSVDLAPQSGFLEDTQSSILPHLERSSHSLCSSHYSDAVETIENVSSAPPAGSPPASLTQSCWVVTDATAEERRTSGAGLEDASSTEDISHIEAAGTPREILLPRRATLTPPASECPVHVLGVPSSNLGDSALLADPQTTPSDQKNNSRQLSPVLFPPPAFPFTTSMPSCDQEVDAIPDVEVQSPLPLATEPSVVGAEYHFPTFAFPPQSPSARVQSVPSIEEPEAVVLPPVADLYEYPAPQTEIYPLNTTSTGKRPNTKPEGPVNADDVTSQPVSVSLNSHFIYTETDSCLLSARQRQSIDAQLESAGTQFSSEDGLRLSGGKPVPQPLAARENSLTDSSAAPSLDPSLTLSVIDQGPALSLIVDPVSATTIESAETVPSAPHNRAALDASCPVPFITSVVVSETADLLSAVQKTAETPLTEGAADNCSVVISSTPADSHNDDVSLFSSSAAAVSTDEETSVIERPFEQTCSTVIEVADTRLTTGRSASPVDAEVAAANQLVIMSYPSDVASDGKARSSLSSSTAATANNEDTSVVEHPSAPDAVVGTETMGVPLTSQKIGSTEQTGHQLPVAVSSSEVPSTTPECRPTELNQRPRRNTVTLENPIQLQRIHAPRLSGNAESSVEPTATAAAADSTTTDLGRHSTEAIVSEDKENVPPKPRRRTTGIRKSVRQADTSSGTKTYSPRQPSLTSVDTEAPLDHLRYSKPPPELIEKEKAQLREEIARLNTLADSLRPVCASYQNAFEEALDLKSRSCMAFGSAAVQARDELLRTQSEAATVQKALEDSHRRFLKIKESIEEKRKAMEAFMSKNESLRSKVSVLAQKGEKYQKYCLEKLVKALELLDAEKQAAEREVNKLRVRAKQLELKVTSLEEQLQRVTEENRELTTICEKLIG
ncbi:hypothetical protein AAHC03_01862 [Spirometra sp. Aus1]